MKKLKEFIDKLPFRRNYLFHTADFLDESSFYMCCLYSEEDLKDQKLLENKPVVKFIEPKKIKVISEKKFRQLMSLSNLTYEQFQQICNYKKLNNI